MNYNIERIHIKRNTWQTVMAKGKESQANEHSERMENFTQEGEWCGMTVSRDYTL